jgi:CheY-like chemotaxis protein
MRPRKVVLLVDPDEVVLGIRKFMLTTRGLAISEATGSAEAIQIFTASHVDLVVTSLALDDMDGNELILRLKAINPLVPMMLISDTVRAGERAHGADCFLGKNDLTPSIVLDRIKVMCQRKRGPRKVLPVVTQEWVNAG